MQQLAHAMGVQASGRSEVDGHAGYPVLRKPAAGTASSTEGAHEDALARLRELMGEFSGVVDGARGAKLRGDLLIWLDRQKTRQGVLDQLSSKFRGASDAYRDALDELTRRGKAVQAAADEANRLSREVGRLKDLLQGLSPDDPKRAELEGALAAARRDAGQATQSLDVALKRLQDGVDKAEHAAKDVDALSDAVRHESGPLQRPPEALEEDIMARLKELQAMFSDIIAKVMSNASRADMKREQQRLEALIADCSKRSEEMSKKMQEARDRERVMGCIGKVVAWLVTAVSLIAAPFTGFASVILAASMLAVAVADEVSGKSLLGEIMKPLMEHVLKPLVEVIGKAVGDLLKEFGVPDAERIGQAIGATLAAIMVVVLVLAAVLVGKAAASRLLPKIMDMAGKMFGRLANDLTKASWKLGTQMGKDSLKWMGQGLSRMTGISSATAAKAAGYAGTAASVALSAGQAVQFGLGVDVAVKRLDIAKLEAAITQNMMENELVRQLLSRAMDWFEKQQSQLEDVQRDLHDLGKRVLRASRDMSEMRTA
ncbi:type III secretion system translocon subunit SctE [Dyella terrae]|nr:type III secretion system translocon subunit SctE [Dyella terrae]